MTELWKLYNTDMSPATDGQLDIGTSSERWANIYLSVGIVSDTITGIKIGTATNQKLGFFNTTPVVQQTSTADLRTALINLGFVATGGASPLDLNGGTFTTTGTADITTLSIKDSVNLVFNNDEAISNKDEAVVV